MQNDKAYNILWSTNTLNCFSDVDSSNQSCANTGLSIWNSSDVQTSVYMQINLGAY